jgi:phenylalanine-4-hydroxylase
MAFMDTTALKNRYENAPRAADFTIDQAWETYSAEEHDRWDRLFRRQKEVTKGRACAAALQAMSQLELSPTGIPHMGRLSDRLEKITGWRVVPVAELVPDEDLLRSPRQPAISRRCLHPP